ILSILLLLQACSSKKAPEASQKAVVPNQVILTDAQLKSAGIQTALMQQKEISSILKVSGKIDVPPQNMVSISVPLGGYLKTTKLLPGQHVSKGEAVAVIEGEQYIQLQQDYLTTKEKIGFLQKEYERQRDLNKTQAASDKSFQQAETEFKTQQVLISAYKEKLKLVGINVDKLSENNISRSINIFSPIDGYVSKVNVNIGKYVSPTEVLFELINPTDIHLALKIFEKDIDKLYVGQPLVAYTNNQPKKKHDCEILLIGKDISEDRNTDVHCHFEDYDKTLIPGTYMNAEIAIKNAKAYVLPEEAIVLFEGKQYGFIKNADKDYSMQLLETGTVDKGFVEILNAEKLASKDFVVKGTYSLLMSLKNKVDE
ncbi:MAG: efflux RND transporter periplasmic adaptor subunit, partial [Sediminibacterium sp.]